VVAVRAVLVAAQLVPLPCVPLAAAGGRTVRRRLLVAHDGGRTALIVVAGRDRLVPDLVGVRLVAGLRLAGTRVRSGWLAAAHGQLPSSHSPGLQASGYPLCPPQTGDPLARRAEIGLDDPALAERDFVAYRADSALEAQIETACAAAGLARRIGCEAENIQYLVEIVRHGGGVAVLPPAALDIAAGPLTAVPIAPPLYREICAVVARGRAPTAAAAALLDLLGRSPEAR
jgi:LysR substrate binding domain-containing protein